MYYRHDHASPLWVQFDKPIGPGDTANVRVVYHGDVIGFGSAIERFFATVVETSGHCAILDRWAFIKETETWFPRYGDEPASFQLTFHHAQGVQIRHHRRLDGGRHAGNVVTTHWVSELPSDQVSFNIGKFDSG